LRRKPDESRLDLINRNVDLFLGILENIQHAGHKKDATVLVVSNPVDVLTYLAAERLDLPPARVLGLGTQLDTVRFRSLIAEQLGAPPTQVKALILGEHGDSMVPIWSSATVAGLPLEKYPGWNAHLASELFTRTKGSGAEVIKKKGGAGFAVGLAIQEVIEAIALDRHAILPVSSVQRGCYDIRNVALSVPTLVGAGGVLGTLEVELWPKEAQALRKSGQVLRQTIDTVLDRLKGAK
jgi:L-lactate dehydrogenase